MLILCPRCRKKLRGKQEWRGRKVRCPACRLLMRLPRNREWLATLMYRSLN